MFFNVNEVLRLPSGNFACQYVTSSPQDAETVVAQFLGSVRMATNFFAELYCRGRVVYVASPSPEITREMAQVLNNSIIAAV